MVSKKEQKLRKDFYSFQDKVNKLEEIKHELNELDIHGFESEAGVIRSRLKDTGAVSEVEKLMKDLRNKIINKKVIKKKSPMKKIEKNFEEIADTNTEIKKEIKNLKSSINTQLVKHIKEDSNVGLVVDKGLQDFIDGVKLELSNRVRNKEKILNDELRKEIEIRKRELDEKYKKMEEKLKEDYNGRIKTELQKEVENKFSDELKKRFEAEKVRLDYLYVSGVKQKYKEEFEKQKAILEKQLNLKLKSEIKKNESLDKNLKEQNEKEMKEKIIEFNKMKEQLTREAHDRLSKELEIKKKKLNAELKGEFIIKMNNFVNQQKLRQTEIVEHQTNLSKQVIDHEKKLNGLLENSISEKTFIIEKLKEKNKELITKQSQLRKEEALKMLTEHQHLIDDHKREIAEITAKIKSELYSRYTDELKKQTNKEKQRLQLEFERKKNEIAEEIHNSSISEREEIKLKLENQYREELKRTISEKQAKLKEQLKKQFKIELDDKVLDERKKLESKISELEKMYREKDQKFKLAEKELINREREKSIEFASEKDKLIDKIKTLKKEDDKIKIERINLQKEFAQKAHQQMVSELKHRETLLSERIKHHFEERLKRHEAEQKKDLEMQRTEIEKGYSQRADNIKHELMHEKKLNEMFNTKLSGMNYSLEKQIDKNKKLIAQQTFFKNSEAKKRAEEHREYIEKHKNEVLKLTEKLKHQMHMKYDAEIKKHVINERERLQKEYEDKKRELSTKLGAIAFREKAEIRRRLRLQFNKNLKNSITQKQISLHEKLRKEFRAKANEQILIERKKLEEKLREVEARYNLKESESRLKEKRVLELERTRDIMLASEKKKFMGKLILFKRNESIKMKNERIKLQREMAEKAHQQMIIEMKNREQLIKSNIQKQFDERLKNALHLQEINLSKKKAELAKELESKAKALMR